MQRYEKNFVERDFWPKNFGIKANNADYEVHVFLLLFVTFHAN